jgi:outer membrane protein OmpA-like peptidoglycan-associated protein
VNIQSREVVLGLALVGLLSYAACTAEKSEMKPQDTSSIPADMPKLVDGVFATQEHLKPVYFELNQSKLTEKEMEVVKENAEWLKSQPPFLVRIIGFTDTRGSMKKNERLAALRAKTVSDSYIALGISKERLSIVGRSKDDLTCQPLTEDCLSKSRRTETLIEEKTLASR